MAIQANRGFKVAAGTPCGKIDQVSAWAKMTAIKVRIIDGPLAGAAGWVNADEVQCD